MPDSELVFADAPETISPTPVTFDRPLPDGLRGDFLRNGPGIQRVGSSRMHLLDGYGYVAALRFAGGGATLLARHVETSAWRKERAAGRALFRKPFTNLPGRLANLFKLNLGNPANHDIYSWGGQLVASDAPGHYLLDPLTLETKGPAPLNAWAKLPAAGPPMPRPDPATGRLMTYFSFPGLRSTRVEVKELGQDWQPVRSVTATVSGAGSFLHDLAFSPRWVALAEFGRLSPWRALNGGDTVYDALNPGKTPLRILLVDRERGGPAHQLELPVGHMGFHLPNAFEDGEAVFVDAVTYQGFVDFRAGYPPGCPRPGPLVDVAAPTLVRHRYLPSTGEHTPTPIVAPPVEAPCVNHAFFGRRHRFVWGPTPGRAGDEESPGGYFWFHGLARVDTEQGAHQVWDAGPRTYLSPPAFVARPGATAEDDGWLVAWTLDAAARRSGAVVLDAAHVDQGPIARAAFDVLLPAVSHCEFVPA